MSDRLCKIEGHCHVVEIRRPALCSMQREGQDGAFRFDQSRDRVPTVGRGGGQPKATGADVVDWLRKHTFAGPPSLMHVEHACGGEEERGRRKGEEGRGRKESNREKKKDRQ